MEAQQPVRADSPDTIVVSPTANGFRIGTRETAGAAVEIEAEGPPAIWVDDHLYRGRVRFVRQGPRKMLVLNVVRLEDYIASVVDGEMPAAFPEAARQAQAIVARTYRSSRCKPIAEPGLRRLRHNAEPELSGLSIPRTGWPA